MSQTGGKATPKQKKFVDYFLTTGKKQQAALAAYNVKSKQNASKIATANLKKPDVLNYMAVQMDRMGLDDDYLGGRLKKIITAGTTEKVLKRATPSDALRGLEMAHKLKDDFPTQKKEIVKKEYKMELNKKSSQELIELLKQKAEEVKKWQALLSNT